MTIAATRSGMVAAGSTATSMSQVCKACSLRRIPTNASKPRFIGPISKLKASRWSAVMLSMLARRATSAVRASSRWAVGDLAFQVSQTRVGEIFRGVPAREDVVEPSAHDDRAGAHVGEHVGDSPFARVGRQSQLSVAHGCHEISEPVDGGPQNFEVRVSHWSRPGRA